MYTNRTQDLLVYRTILSFFPKCPWYSGSNRSYTPLLRRNFKEGIHQETICKFNMSAIVQDWLVHSKNHQITLLRVIPTMTCWVGVVRWGLTLRIWWEEWRIWKYWFQVFLGLVILVRWALVTMLLSWTTQTGCRIHRTYVSLTSPEMCSVTLNFADWLEAIFWRSFWHIFWHSFLTNLLIYLLTFFLTYSSDILSDISFDTLSDISSGHSFWHIFRQAF